MVAVLCRHCGSDRLVKNGHNRRGKQLYKCHACSRQSREEPGSNAYSPERKAEILRAYEERSSLRGLTRTFGVSRTTVIAWLKGSAEGQAEGAESAEKGGPDAHSGRQPGDEGP
jgi:transposase-like protein